MKKTILPAIAWATAGFLLSPFFLSAQQSTPLNSERLRRAKHLFDEGKIREADNVLNAKEMQQEGDALLAEKTREQEKLRRTDSLLRIKADEFALKARLKATDYADSLRYDSATLYFEQSRRYVEIVYNLSEFAYLLGQENQTPRDIGYYEKALRLARSESEEATLSMNLGNFYKDVQKMQESEKMYLRFAKNSYTTHTHSSLRAVNNAFG